MTLREYINKKRLEENDLRIYVGSGSQFFFIGNIDEAARKIEYLSDKYPENYLKTLNGLKNKLESDQKSIPRLFKEIDYLKEEINGMNNEIKLLLKGRTYNRLERREMYQYDELSSMREKCLYKIDKIESIIKNKVDISIPKTIERIPRLEKQLEEFTPFLDRKIVYVFRKNSMPDEMGVAIKIDGNDDGKYWTYKEYITGVVEEDDD